MKYMGSKSRHAPAIIGSILNHLPVQVLSDIDNYYWVEPFVGGCNMIDKVSNLFFNRIGNDINPYLINMFIAIQNGWEPPSEVSEEEYHKYKEMSNNALEWENPMVAFVGIGCSYAGKWFGGYARGDNANGQARNYCLESKNNLLSQKKNITGVNFENKDYLNLTIPKNSVIYCDPPYNNTTSYGAQFNSGRFWPWCESLAKKGRWVFVSEYNAPSGWESIWEKKVNSSLTKDTGNKKGIEKLFIYRG